MFIHVKFVCFSNKHENKPGLPKDRETHKQLVQLNQKCFVFALMYLFHYFILVFRRRLLLWKNARIFSFFHLSLFLSPVVFIFGRCCFFFLKKEKKIVRFVLEIYKWKNNLSNVWAHMLPEMDGVFLIMNSQKIISLLRHTCLRVMSIRKKNQTEINYLMKSLNTSNGAAESNSDAVNFHIPKVMWLNVLQTHANKLPRWICYLTVQTLASMYSDSGSNFVRNSFGERILILRVAKFKIEKKKKFFLPWRPFRHLDA